MSDLEKRKVGGMSVWRAAMFFMWMDLKTKVREHWLALKWLHALLATGVNPENENNKCFAFGQFFAMHMILCMVGLATFVYVTEGVSSYWGDVAVVFAITGFGGMIMGFLTSGFTMTLDRFIKHLLTRTKTKVLEYKRSVMLRADAYALESGSLTLVGMEERPEIGALYVYDGSQAGDISFCTEEATDLEKERWLDVSTNHPHDVRYWGKVVDCPAKIKVGDIVYLPSDSPTECFKVDHVDLKTYMPLRAEAKKLALERKYTPIQIDIDSILSRSHITKDSGVEELAEAIQERYVFDVLVELGSNSDYSRTGEIMLVLGYSAFGGKRHVVDINDVREFKGKKAFLSQLKKSILELAERFINEECGIEAGGHFTEPVLMHGGIISGDYVFKDLFMGDHVPTRVNLKPFDFIHDGFKAWKVVAMHFKNVKAPEPGIYADYADGVEPKSGDHVIVKSSYARDWLNSGSAWYALKAINRPRIVKTQKRDGVTIIEDLDDEETLSLENKYLMKIIRA